MRLSLRYHPAVKQDVRRARMWYEDKRAGLGDEFMKEVHTVLDHVREHPEIYEVVRGNVRRGVTNRFPYIVLYRVEPERVVILGVFHGSRDPIIWDERI